MCISSSFANGQHGSRRLCETTWHAADVAVRAPLIVTSNSLPRRFLLLSCCRAESVPAALDEPPVDRAVDVPSVHNRAAACAALL